MNETVRLDPQRDVYCMVLNISSVHTSIARRSFYALILDNRFTHFARCNSSHPWGRVSYSSQ